MQMIVDNRSQTVIIAKETYRIELAKVIYTYIHTYLHIYILKNGEQQNQIAFRYKVNMQLKDQV